MKEEKLYRCEFCNTQYADKKVCETCEKNHKKIKDVKAVKYLSIKNDKTGIPNKILVTFDDGEEYMYVR